MKTLTRALVVLGISGNLIVGVAAQEVAKGPVKSGGQASPLVGPTTLPPTTPPPPPPATLPEPPPQQPRDIPQEKPTAGGQWVYTSQYGWVWMPYGDRFTHVPRDGSPPNMYVYYPEAGWSWVVAPWLWGWGAEPYFGHLGSRYYAWYGTGLGHWYGFAGAYAHWGWSGRAYWGRGHWNSVSRFYGHSSGGYYGGRGSHYSSGGGHHGGGGHR